MSNNRQYRVVMDNFDVITLMGVLDAAASEATDESTRERLYDIVKQLDEEHTRFLNDPINLENTMSTTTERKPIDDAIDEILYDRFIVGTANTIIIQAKESGVTEDQILLEITKKLAVTIRKQIADHLNK